MAGCVLADSALVLASQEMPKHTPLTPPVESDLAHTLHSCRAQPNGNFNQVLQSVDVHVGQGNPGAIGIRHRAAQMSAIEHVDVVLESGLVGLEGLPGAGGSIADVLFLGGSYGIDARVTQPTSVLTGVRFSGQACAAVVYDGVFGQQTLVGVGLAINITEASLTNTAFYVPGNGLPPNWPPLCALLPMDRLPFVPPGASGPQNVTLHDWPGGGWLSLIDSVATFASAGAQRAPSVATTQHVSPCALITTYTSVVLHNVYLVGCLRAVAFVGTPAAAGQLPDVTAPATLTIDSHKLRVSREPSTAQADAPSPGTTSPSTGPPVVQVREVLVGVVSDPTTVAPNSSCYAQNTSYTVTAERYSPAKQPETSRVAQFAQARVVPADLRTQHLWNEYTLPGFQSTGDNVVDVQAHGVIGDGVTDNWAALQHIFDNAGQGGYNEARPLIVLLPAGVYGLSQPLRLPEDTPTAVVGVGHIFSELVALANFSVDESAATPTGPTPLFQTGAALTWLCGVGVSVSAGVSGVYPVLWRTQHPESAWHHSRTAMPPPPPPNKTPQLQGVDYPQVVFAGSGRIQNWMNDEGCGGVDRLGHTSNCSLNYRHMLIVNASNLRFYMMDPEHLETRASIEVRDSRNVTVFGFKDESGHTAMWIHISTVTLHGLGGMAAAAPLPADPDWPPGVFVLSGGSEVFLYSLATRAECSPPTADPSKWSMVCRETGASTLPRASSPTLTCTDHHDFPIAYTTHPVSGVPA